MENSLYLLVASLVVSYSFAFILLRFSADLQCKVFAGAMFFSIFSTVALWLFDFLSYGISSMNSAIPISITMLVIAFLLPELEKGTRHATLVRRIERRYYDPSVVDFLILYVFNWISVYIFIELTRAKTLPGSQVAEHIIRHPLRLLSISFVWLLGGNISAEEVPLDYPHIGPGLLILILNTLILFETYLNAWLEKLTLRLKHHRLKDKPTGLRLRDHAVIWGDRKLIKEIVREYASRRGVLPRDIILVSRQIRDIQFISATGSPVYSRLWVIDGSLGDPDVLHLADMAAAHEFGIIDIAGEDNPIDDVGEKLSLQSLVSAVSEITMGNSNAQICAVVPDEKDAQRLQKIRKLLLKGRGNRGQRREEDFIFSAKRVRDILFDISRRVPGMIDALYDIFSYRNLGSVDGSTNVTIVPLKNPPPTVRNAVLIGNEIMFKVKMKKDDEGKTIQEQWFVIRGLHRIVGTKNTVNHRKNFSGIAELDVDLAKVRAIQDIGNNLSGKENSISFYHLVSQSCKEELSMEDMIDILWQLRKWNNESYGERKQHGEKNAIFYLRLNVNSFLLGETILKNFRKKMSQMHRKSNNTNFWGSLIMDIIDVPLFSAILVGRCLLTDKGNKLFKYIGERINKYKRREIPSYPIKIFTVDSPTPLKVVFDRLTKDYDMVPIYFRDVVTGEGRHYTLIYALDIS